MAKLRHKSISKRTVDALPIGKDTVFWDSELAGFGVRVHASGNKVYVVQTRGPGGPKRVTVGRHGVISADQARQRAALVIARIKAGEEPVPAPRAAADGPTVAELAERYLREHAAVRCKPGTEARYRLIVARHILPALGAMAVAAVGRSHVTELHHRLRDTPTMANMAIATLSQMIDQGGAWGMVPEGGNPCRFVVKYRERRCERFLTGEEFRRLGRVLDKMEAASRVPAHAAAGLRLLMLTGCRRNEILTLRWDDVHLEVRELRLRDAKTGPRAVLLSPAAAKVLAELPRVPATPWVIAGRRPGTRVTNIDKHWRRVRAHAGLDDVRLHDLRHSFASRALALGESLPMIGKLLGHSQIQTTARYAHLARDAVHDSAARVAASIGADILSEDSLALPVLAERPPSAGTPSIRSRVWAAGRDESAALPRDTVAASAARIAASIGTDILSEASFTPPGPRFQVRAAARLDSAARSRAAPSRRPLPGSPPASGPTSCPKAPCPMRANRRTAALEPLRWFVAGSRLSSTAVSSQGTWQGIVAAS